MPLIALSGQPLLPAAGDADWLGESVAPNPRRGRQAWLIRRGQPSLGGREHGLEAGIIADGIEIGVYFEPAQSVRMGSFEYAREKLKCAVGSPRLHHGASKVVVQVKIVGVEQQRVLCPFHRSVGFA